MSKTLTISSGEHFHIYIREHKKYETVKIEQTGSWRHGYTGYMIFKDPDTDKFYKAAWRNSSNEMNGWEDMNFGEQQCHEVEPKQKTITVYEKVEQYGKSSK